MRRLKFRVFDPINKEFTILSLPQIGSLQFQCASMDWKNAMQYTGLKDKNGKEIYEGDIIGWDDVTLKAAVTFNDGVFGYRAMSYYPLHYGNKSCEVIGNIYENLELLRDEE